MAQLKDLIVNGPSRFIGDVYATTFTGDLNGNASTATSANTAAALTGKTLVTASAVTTSNWPTYADNYIPTMSFMAHWNGAYSGTSSNLAYCAQGDIIGSNNIGSQSVNYATTSGSCSGSCSGNAATATKLYSTIVHPFSSSVFAYRKFASINIKQYEGKTALLLLKSYSTPSTLCGNSCKVYVNAYQQTSLGTLPRYNIETDCDDRFFSIYAVVNYTSTLSTIDLYVYGKEMPWYSIDVTLLSGDNIIDIGDVINNLPDGVVITPTKYGSVYSATKLATARTIWGQSFDGTGNIDGSLHINSTGNSWNEGIRMHAASDGWSGIIMCGSDNTGMSGTSPNT